MEEVITLEIDVVRFDLVPFPEAARTIDQLGAEGPSEALLGVTIYGMVPMGAKKRPLRMPRICVSEQHITKRDRKVKTKP